MDFAPHVASIAEALPDPPIEEGVEEQPNNETFNWSGKKKVKKIRQKEDQARLCLCARYGQVGIHPIQYHYYHQMQQIALREKLKLLKLILIMLIL